MQIPRKYIDNFTKALNKLSADAQKRLADDLAKISFDGNIATIRDALITRMEFYCGPYTDMAAIVAAEFYDGLRKFQTGAALGALAESGREPIATEKAVRAIMQDVVEGKPTEAVMRKLIDRVDYEIKKSAGECVYRNGKRDPLKPRYARVPSGGETCEFCLMLASRGFVYLTKKSAGEGNHYHANCDCRIVPGFDGETTVPGYDPDRLYDQWKNPDKYPELREARNERRRELYAAKKPKTQARRTTLDDAVTKWSNSEIENLADSQSVKAYLRNTFGIQATESFSELPIEKQRAAVAGISDATGRYGASSAENIKLIAGSSTDQGQYDPNLGTILLNGRVKDAYVVAYHETIHAIDAEKSSKYKGFASSPAKTAYNMHSAKVLENARKSLGIKANSKEYRNLLAEVFGYNLLLADEYRNDSGEVVAYALDREVSGKGNRLSKAIAERF